MNKSGVLRPYLNQKPIGPSPLLQRKDVKASDADVNRMSGPSGPVGGPYGNKVHHSVEGDHRTQGHHQNRGHQSPLGGGQPPQNNRQIYDERRNRAQSPINRGR
jgi:hypothetical protein